MKKYFIGLMCLTGVIYGCSFIHTDKGKESRDMHAMVESDVVLTVDKKEVHFDHYKNGHKSIIIIAHGFYNSKQAVLFREMAEMLNDNYDVIVFDFRGHGKTKGPFTWTKNEPLDLEAIIDKASQEYEQVGVLGFSLGAATSIITAASSDKIDSVIVVSPPSDFDKIDFKFWQMGVMENIVYNMVGEGRIGKGVRPGWPWRKKVKPIEVVQKIQVPVLFIHGEKDWLIQPWHSKKLFEKAQGDKHILLLKEATHAEYIFRSDRLNTISIFKDWFSNTLKSTRST